MQGVVVIKRRVLFGGLVLALAVTAGGWWLSQSAAASSVSPLEATGAGEVEEGAVAPEVGGSGAEDAVNRGSNLSPDDPKRAAAEAALYNARHARDKIKANLNWYTGSPTDFDQEIRDVHAA